MTQLGETVAIGLIGPGSDLDKFKTWETWDFDEAFQFVDWAGDPIGNVRYEILMSGCSHQYGVTDDQGRIPRLKGYHPLGLKVRFLGITKPPGSARPIPETDSKRVCLAIPDIEGTPIFRWSLTKSEFSDHVLLVIKSCFLPVIFVPGGLGSNLRDKKTGKSVWRLNATLGIPVDLITSYASLTPVDRKRKLNHKLLEVDLGGYVPLVPSIGDEAAVRERGWGGIGEATYTGYLLWLEQHLNQVSPNPARWTDFYHDDVTIGTAPKPGAQPKLSPGVKIGIVGQPFSAEMPFKSLRTDDLLARSRFYMPVHAYGYNWLASCTDAGLGLKAFIEEVIKLYDRDPFWCRQVVLVTHSMGGLVARYCATLPGMADKIAGVVHGVMPTNGAAVAYRRCKVGAGDEGSGLLEAFGYLSFFGVLGSWKNFKEAFSARVIGNSGRDVAAFFPQAPGALQLLPTKDYFQGWLKFQYKGQSVASWPASDPYEEIYRRGDNWWGLVREEWLRPASGTFFSWSDFLTNVDRAEAFHESIRHKYHAFTYIIYGCDSKQKSFETVTWKISDGDSPESFEDRGIEKLLAMSPSVVCWDWLPTADESKRKDRYSHSTPMFSGSYSKQQSFVNSSWIVSKGIAIDPVEKHGVEKVLAMSPREVSMDGSPTAFVVGNISGYSSTTPMFAGSKWLFHCETQDGSGDGTVPVSSGRAPLHDNCVAVKQQFAMRGFDHQGAFDDDQVRNASLYSITKIAAAAKKP